MNAPFAPVDPLKEAQSAATYEVCRWRGHCLDLFARIERESIDALDAMIASKRVPGLVHTALFGARIEVIRTALDSGKFGNTAKIKSALEKLDGPLTQRNHIVHGVGKVWINANGEWLWIFDYRSNAKTPALVEGRLTSIEAHELEKTLKDSGQSFTAQLRNLTLELKAEAVTE